MTFTKTPKQINHQTNSSPFPEIVCINQNVAFAKNRTKHSQKCTQHHINHFPDGTTFKLPTPGVLKGDGHSEKSECRLVGKISKSPAKKKGKTGTPKTFAFTLKSQFVINFYCFPIRFYCTHLQTATSLPCFHLGQKENNFLLTLHRVSIFPLSIDRFCPLHGRIICGKL